MQEIKPKAITTQNSSALLPTYLARYLLWGIVSLVGLWLVIKLFVIGSALVALRGYQLDAEALLSNGITELNGDELETMVLGVREEVLVIKSETAVFYPLLTRLGWVPKVGPTLKIAPQLLDMADGGTETAAYAIRGLKPAFAILQTDNLGGEEQLAALLQVIEQAKPDINQASISFQTVSSAYSAIDNMEDQPEQIANLLAKGGEWLPIAEDGLKLMTVLPEIAGVDGQKSYLLLAQNEDELRATGGFISGAGVLTVENGRLLSFDFTDAYNIDNFEKPYGDPPSAFTEIMAFDLFVFRDANFWPDFPTSAQQTMALYSYGQELPPLDGAIAFNQSFLANLLKATGPVTIPENNVTLTSGNIEQALQNAWGESSGENWSGDRKAFLGTFAQAIQEKLLTNFDQLDPITLVKEVTTAADAQSIQIYMESPEVAAVLNEVNWDGRLENPAQSDYLLVVDTNVGFNKTNLNIERQLNYAVTIDPSFVTHSSLTISYMHNGQTAPDCTQNDILVPTQPTYEEISNQCYWNYVRVYTPPNTQLTQSSAHPISGERIRAAGDWAGTFRSINDLPGWAVMDNLLLIESGQSAPYQLNYQNNTLVQEIAPGQFQYTLQLGQQAGIQAETRSATITLPSGSTILEVSPTPTEIVNTTVYFQELPDATLTIRFEQ